MAHWLIVEPKQSIFFFKTFISLLIKEEVEHAIGEVCDTTLAWQTCALILLCKTSFFFKQTFNSFEIKIILFFKESFSFKTKTSFEDRASFFFQNFITIIFTF